MAVLEDLRALFTRITRSWQTLTRGDVHPVRDPTVTFDFRLTAIYCSFCHRYGVYVGQISGQEGRHLEVAHCPSCDAGWMIAERVEEAEEAAQGAEAGDDEAEAAGRGNHGETAPEGAGAGDQAGPERG